MSRTNRWGPKVLQGTRETAGLVVGLALFAASLASGIAAAGVTQEQARAQMARACDVLRGYELGAEPQWWPTYALERSGARPVWMATRRFRGTSVPLNQTQFSAEILVFTKVSDAVPELDERLRRTNAERKTRCFGTGEGDAYAGGCAGIFRCENVVLEIAWRKGMAPGAFRDEAVWEAYNREGLVAVRDMLGRLHEAFAAAGVCAARGGSRPQPAKPTPKPPAPTAPPTAEPAAKGSLTVTLALDSFSQCLADGYLQGEVTVRAPASVPPGTPVTVSLVSAPDSSAVETRDLFSGFEEAKAEDRKPEDRVPAGARVRTENLVLDGARQVTARLGSNPLWITLPNVQPNAPPRQCCLLAFAWIGDEYYGTADAAYVVATTRKGTRFVSLAPAPDPAVAGKPVKLTLVCEVNGLPAGTRSVPVNAEGRLLWRGAPADLWADGRDAAGAATKFPPMIPLPAQRVVAQAVDGEPQRARAEVSWTVQLRGAGEYVAALDIAPVGFDVLQREASFTAVEVRTPPPPAAQGQTQVTHTVDGEQGVTQQTPADAPAGTTNLAFGKPAGQCCPVERRGAHFAVDGAKVGNVEFRAGAQCGVAGAPYWTVDLGQVAEVDEVRLYNWITNEHMASYAKWIEVWFATVPTNSHQVYIRGDNDTWGLDGKPLVIGLKNLPAAERQARYVTLRNGGDPPLDINLLEVEVYGRFVGQAPAEVAPPPGAQPGAGDGARRETAGGEIVTLGPLKLQVRDGKVFLTAEAYVPDEPARLPLGTQLVSIGGKAVQVATTQELVKLLEPHQDGWAVMRFQLPDGKEMIVTIED